MPYVALVCPSSGEYLSLQKKNGALLLLLLQMLPYHLFYVIIKCDFLFYFIFLHRSLTFVPFLSSAWKDVGATGVERGSHAGLLRSWAGLRRRHRVLQLQQAWQQLPLWRSAGLHHQLCDLHPGHFSRVCCPGLQGECHEREVCCRVSVSPCNKRHLPRLAPFPLDTWPADIFYISKFSRAETQRRSWAS